MDKFIKGWKTNLAALISLPLLTVCSDYYCTSSCGIDQYCCEYNQCCSTIRHKYVWNLWYFWFTLVLFIIIAILLCGYLRKKRKQQYEASGVIVYSTQANAVRYLPQETAVSYANTNTTHYITPVYQETVTPIVATQTQYYYQPQIDTNGFRNNRQ